MKRLKLALFISLFFIGSTVTLTAFAQDWMSITEDPNISLSQIKTVADAWFAENGTGKGTGFKQYQRWLYTERMNRDENGYLIDFNQKKTSFADWQIQQNETLALGSAGVSASNWIELGPHQWEFTSGWNPGVGRVTSIGFHPTDENIFFITSPGGGLWKTTDGGQTWNCLTDNVPYHELYSVTLDPNDENRIYMGGARGDLYFTDDNGGAWTSPAGLPPGRINKILVYPNASDTVLVATSYGIYRSENHGSSFYKVTSQRCDDIIFKSGNPRVIYASDELGFYRSDDGGKAWSQVTENLAGGGRTRIAVSPADPNKVYILRTLGGKFDALYRSDDGGLTFSTRDEYNGSTNNYMGYASDGSSSAGQGTYDLAMAIDPQNADHVTIAGIIVWESFDGGQSFTSLTEWYYPNGKGYNHADVHVLAYNGNELFSGSDGGIYRRDTKLSTGWQDLSSGLGTRQFYRIGGSATVEYLISGGAQDNGTSLFKNGSWIDWLGADGMETFVDWSNPDVIYGTSQNGSLYKSTDRGENYFGLTDPESNGAWVTPWVQHPTASETIFAGYTEIHKSTNGGSSWTQLSSLGGSYFNDLVISPADPNYIYATKNYEAYGSKDGGDSWAQIDDVAWNSAIEGIAVDPDDANRVAVVLRDYSNRIFVSEDAGTTWQNIDVGGIPSSTRPACIIGAAGAENAWYVGTEEGIYYYDDLLTSWVPYMTDLPLIAVEELEIQEGFGKIRAATYGRGLWEAPLRASGALPIVLSDAQIQIDKGRLSLLWQDNSRRRANYIIYRTDPENALIWNEIGRLNHTENNGKYRFTVDAISAETEGTYRIQLRTESGAIYDQIEVGAGAILPETIALLDSYPNPFNTQSNIGFTLPDVMQVTLTVYNVQGEVVRVLASGEFPAGRHNITFNAQNLAAGVYLYELKTDRTAIRKTVVLVK